AAEHAEAARHEAGQRQHHRAAVDHPHGQVVHLVVSASAPSLTWIRCGAPRSRRRHRARPAAPQNSSDAMDFAASPRTETLLASLQRFMDDLIVPSCADWHRWADAGVYPLDVIEPLKVQARALGLWNLCLPGLRDGQPGTRLSNLEYAPL